MKIMLGLLFFIVSTLHAKDILILHSYHPSFSWTKSQNKAILNNLSNSKEKHRVYIEYMDTKRTPYTPTYDKELFNLYKYKYKNKNIDLVLATDDNAINFIKKHQKKLFDDIFIVFSGVSNLKVLENYSYKNITGVYEKMTPIKNYKLAKKIDPKIKKIYLIGDDSNTFNIKKPMFDNEFKKESINYEYISNKNIEIVEEKLKNIEPNSIAFIITPSSFTDSNKIVYTMEMAIKRLTKVYNKPFISISNIYMIGHNVIGGHTVNAINQGELAGKLALDILNKNKINPPILNTNNYIFDYEILKKFKIDVKDLNLKEEYKLINIPKYYFDEHKNQIFIGLAILGVFLIIFIISIFYSIKLKKLNEKLQSSDKYNKKLLDSLLEGMVLIENFTCVDCNEELVKMLNFNSKNELIGKDIMNFVAHKDKQRVRERVETDSIQPAELTLLTREKKEIHVLTMGRNINLDNRILRITTFIDISEAKKKDKLLFEQSKLAAMGEMIGNISHQWRQPLSVISSAASGIRLQKEMGILSDELFYESTDVIVKSTNYLSQTIEDFKNYIKGNNSIESLNINEPINTCLSLLKSTFINNNVTLIKNNEDYIIFSNKNEVIQILINILNNAKDALVEKETSDKLLFITSYEEEKNVIISIKDNAGGVPEDIINKIFDPYFTTKGETQGTGLGLYMSYQLTINSLKGKIEVSNEKYVYKGKEQFGANFKIFLPK